VPGSWIGFKTLPARGYFFKNILLSLVNSSFPTRFYCGENILAFFKLNAKAEIWSSWYFLIIPVRVWGFP